MILNNILRLRKLFCNIHDNKNFISTNNSDCQLISLSIKRGKNVIFSSEMNLNEIHINVNQIRLLYWIISALLRFCLIFLDEHGVNMCWGGCWNSRD